MLCGMEEVTQGSLGLSLLLEDEAVCLGMTSPLLHKLTYFCPSGVMRGYWPTYLYCWSKRHWPTQFPVLGEWMRLETLLYTFPQRAKYLTLVLVFDTPSTAPCSYAMQRKISSVWENSLGEILIKFPRTWDSQKIPWKLHYIWQCWMAQTQQYLIPVFYSWQRIVASIWLVAALLDFVISSLLNSEMASALKHLNFWIKRIFLKQHHLNMDAIFKILKSTWRN